MTFSIVVTIPICGLDSRFVAWALRGPLGGNPREFLFREDGSLSQWVLGSLQQNAELEKRERSVAPEV